MAETSGSSRSRPRAIVGALLLVGGLGLAMYGLVASFADEAGYPWDTSITNEGGSIVVTIEHEDGRVETYEAASREEAGTIVEERTDELVEEYDLEGTATVGTIALVVGLVIATAGVALLVAASRARRAASAGS
jgi:hypothetical protein